MKIALLGWGSLTWDPASLPIDHNWQTDGPLIFVEFARQSQDGRITAVLTEGGSIVNSLWTTFDTEKIDKIDDAVEALRFRENIFRSNVHKHIGVWQKGDDAPFTIPNIHLWAAVRDIDVIVWTNLPPKFNGVERLATPEEIVSYIKELWRSNNIKTQQKVEQYFRRAPKQIYTTIRHNVEKQFGWYPDNQFSISCKTVQTLDDCIEQSKKEKGNSMDVKVYVMAAIGLFLIFEPIKHVLKIYGLSSVVITLGYCLLALVLSEISSRGKQK